MLTITVKTLTGHSNTFECVDPSLTVGRFKVAVAAGNRGFLLPCVQRLIYKGKQLEDHQPLNFYPLEAPILIHLVLRQAGGSWYMPPILSSFPHEKDIRSICVNGQHWWDVPLPEPQENRMTGWFPEGIHEDPAPIELYRQLITDIRDTPLTVEEVGHRILTEYGYVKREDDWYTLPSDKRIIRKAIEKEQKEKKQCQEQEEQERNPVVAVRVRPFTSNLVHIM